MSKAILILNRPMLEEVYRVNFKNYLDIDLECTSNAEEAIALTKKHGPNHYSLVLVLTDLDSGRGIETVATKLTELTNDLKVIGLGSPVAGKSLPDVTYIDDPYELKNVIAPVARLLGITAKEMAAKEVPPLVPVPLKLFLHFIKAPCDLYLNYQEGKSGAKESYSLLMKIGTSTEERIQKQMNTGLKNLYIPKEHRLNIINLASETLVHVLKNEQAPIDEKLDGLDKGLNLLSEYIGLKEIPKDKIQELGSLCVSEMQSTVKKIPKIRELIIMLLQNKASFTFTHSILSSYIAEAIIEQMPWGAKGQSEKLSYAFFFHDIFLTPIINKIPDTTSEEELLFGEQLSEKEKEILLQHARMAHDLVVTLPQTPVGAETIIMQHHGSRGGVDFTTDYPDYLAPLSKVAIISHAVAELILENKKDNQNYEVEIKSIMNEMKERFRRPTYLKIIEALVKVKGF